jgi:hypothetical protein
MQRPAVIERSDGRLRRRMTLYLSPELARALKVHAAERDAEMSDIVAAAVEAFLENVEP